ERARLRAEAEALAKVPHPHIVQIYEVGEQAGCPYLALEYVAGGSLAQQLDGTPLPTVPAARLVFTLAGAVHHAHEHQVVHRDLKPANVLLASGACERPGDSEPGPPPILARHAPLAIPKITDFG